MTAENRRFALSVAAGLADHLDLDEDGIVRVFGRLYRLLEPTRRLIVVAWIDGQPATLTGGVMALTTVNATVDNTTVTISVLPEDDHNDPTSDQLTWGNDDTAGTLGTLAVADDTHSAVFTFAQPQVEGTVNLTIGDPSAPNLENAQVQIVIGAGGTSQLAVTATVA